jgi:hypothetical protein
VQTLNDVIEISRIYCVHGRAALERLRENLADFNEKHFQKSRICTRTGHAIGPSKRFWYKFLQIFLVESAKVPRNRSIKSPQPKTWHQVLGCSTLCHLTAKAQDNAHVQLAGDTLEPETPKPQP